MAFQRRRDPPRGVVFGPDRGTTEPIALQRLVPPADLASMIEHVWIVRWDVRASGEQTSVTLPHPSVQWVIEGGRSELMGVVTGRFVRVLEGVGRVVGVRFRTAGFAAFTERPLHELTNRVVPATEMLGAPPLARELERLADDDAAARMLEHLRTRTPRLPADARRAQRIADRIVADRELTTVARVCTAFATTPLTLQRLFRKTIGVTPKWIIQRARIHEAVERIVDDARRGKKTPFAELADELGFTDQAHFTRTFGAFVGTSPRAYARRVGPTASPSESKPKRSRRSEAEEAKEKKKRRSRAEEEEAREKPRK